MYFKYVRLFIYKGLGVFFLGKLRLYSTFLRVSLNFVLLDGGILGLRVFVFISTCGYFTFWRVRISVRRLF